MMMRQRHLALDHHRRLAHDFRNPGFGIRAFDVGDEGEACHGNLRT
jgi:hypothetical protein